LQSIENCISCGQTIVKRLWGMGPISIDLNMAKFQGWSDEEIKDLTNYVERIIKGHKT
jgi:hypothetical protein